MQDNVFNCVERLKKIFLWAGLIVLLLAFSPSESPATPEYATQTGRPCIDCHLGPSGGGPLIPFGERYFEGLKTGGPLSHTVCYALSPGTYI